MKIQVYRRPDPDKNKKVCKDTGMPIDTARLPEVLNRPSSRGMDSPSSITAPPGSVWEHEEISQLMDQGSIPAQASAANNGYDITPDDLMKDMDRKPIDLDKTSTDLLYAIERKLMDLENASGNTTLGAFMKRQFFGSDSIARESPEKMKAFLAHLDKEARSGGFRSAQSSPKKGPPDNLMDTIPGY